MTVLQDGAVVTVLTPERRTFIVDGQTTAEAAIHTNALRDLYAVLGEERGGAAVLRLHHNPFAPWIWFGGLAMAFGGMLSLALAAGPAAARSLAESTELFQLAESLGGVESLVNHPAVMTHASVPPENRARLGIADDLVRLSVGVESVDDLRADLMEAMSTR